MFPCGSTEFCAEPTSAPESVADWLVVFKMVANAGKFSNSLSRSLRHSDDLILCADLTVNVFYQLVSKEEK
jgi:hypothetical protein